jgi:Protein of unknown function (DUF3570)
MTTYPLSTLTAAAMVLPGLLPAISHAAEDDSVDFQYSHYQEGKRDIYGNLGSVDNGILSDETIKLPQNLNPIEVDSIHGSGRFSLTDRIKFAFNYTQDTWSGATPIGTKPTGSGNGNAPVINKINNKDTVVGASPFICSACSSTGRPSAFMDKNKNFYLPVTKFDPTLITYTTLASNRISNQFSHVLSYASPETRKQGDFKLSYAWDEAELSVGGGISVEDDYESRFGNLGGRFDFNQKQTMLNWGLSYTNSDTYATLDPDTVPSFIGAGKYFDTEPAYDFIYDADGLFAIGIIQKPRRPEVKSGAVKRIISYDVPSQVERIDKYILYGNRQDWGSQLGISHILNKNTVLDFGFNYTRSTGYLGNPYKVVYHHQINFEPGQTIGSGHTGNLLEVRPDERNLFNWQLGYSQFIEPLSAALHFNYNFAHDDWGIHAHTFEADWVQPVGSGWTITPRIRYYSQSAADFYTTGIYTITDENTVRDASGNIVSGAIELPPEYYSSDQRLSGFGTLSGGVTVEKQFAKGLSLQTGFEYYTHQGSLKLGGGGEGDFADFDYWVANAALKVNLAALETAASHGGHLGHAMHHHHSNAPAGVQFDHVLPNAGDFMVGYRYMRNVQAGDFRLGDQMISIDQARKEGCYGEECAVTPNNMTMNMHMLDLMYAPTDWLTLMLMPQWVDMDMTMTPNPNIQNLGGHGGHGAVHEHQTGGIGDVGAYGLFKLYGDDHHKINLALGGTAPSGDVDIMQRKTGANPIYNNPLHYCMQLGSGTWDFKPALTYTGQADKFSWGAQANATIRLEGKNKSGFAFGDIFQGTAWGGYQWTDWLGTTVRGVYTTQGEIKGRYPTIFADEGGFPSTEPYIDKHIDTFSQPENYGGSFVDLGLGINVTVPHGAFAGNTLKFEWLQPIYTNFNGYQPDRDYALNFTWSYGF